MPGKGINLDEYVDVAERIKLFKEKHPEGTLQSEIIPLPEEGFPFVAMKAYAYRTPDDPRPGIGHAWEPFPGLTPYTRNSELQNAETSAWGRAIVAALAADTKKIASKQEVRNRRDEKPWPDKVTETSGGSGGAVAGASEYGEGSQPDLSDTTPMGGGFGQTTPSDPDLSDTLEAKTLAKIVDKYGVDKALAAARRMGIRVTSLGQLTEDEGQQMLDAEVSA